jgi:hypothetical protein
LATSTDQYPFPSAKSGREVAFQKLNVPATDTPVALGANVRKVVPMRVPEAYGIAPIPGRVEMAANVVDVANSATINEGIKAGMPIVGEEYPQKTVNTYFVGNFCEIPKSIIFKT